MTNNLNGGQKSIKTQLEKYGSKEALSAEMARRAKMRKTIGKGGFYNPEVALKAARKSAEVRKKNAENKSQEVQEPNSENAA